MKGLSLGALVAAALGVGALGYLAGRNPTYALLGALLVLGIGLIAHDLVLIPFLAIPGVLVLGRVGGGNGLSISDAVLLVATLCALLQLQSKESVPLRWLLWMVVAYQACLIPTLLLNPYSANVIEWVHESVLVGGSLAVGCVVGRAGRARRAVGLYVAGCAFLGLAAAAVAPFEHFQPVYLNVFLFSYQKNALGDLLAFAVIIAYARPAWLGWTSRSAANLAVLACLTGILATQSKQAMISVAVGVAVILLRGRLLGHRSRVVLLAVLPLIVLAYVVAANELASSNQFNAVHQRLKWYGDSIDVWRMSRVFGVGLRWWYTSRFPVSFQPPNAELEMLTSAGIVGLAIFVAVSCCALALLWRIDPVFGTLAVAILAARLVQGQLDLYWVASQTSLPWLVVGVALGAQCLSHARTAVEPKAGWPAAPSGAGGPRPPIATWQPSAAWGP